MREDGCVVGEDGRVVGEDGGEVGGWEVDDGEASGEWRRQAWVGAASVMMWRKVT